MTNESPAPRRGRPKISEPHPVDLHVGHRVRAQRQALGLSQDRLGKELGLTFQQVQKYERGMNRVSASRLFELGQVLNVPADFFFRGLDHDLEKSAANTRTGFAEGAQEGFTVDALSNRETMELVRAYSAIRDPKVKRQFLEMIKALAATEANKD
jgi:transcriptional regulator with XRE-family HTH domain